ncbi:protein-disulfide reductase DsbD [uncultured Muribaculum sp.]|uniref:protein-disulfide reductase DsbD family protein n=3 Tax=uncultured Muribaculum sp. TaxID=1918613 RepID=UPI0026706616|nr:cytochrome c biogenesis protein CcdA [uncultured Muribaculum sp.]
MKKIYTLICIIVFLCINQGKAQMVEPVKWDIKIEQNNASEAQIIATMKIDHGWHVYSNEVNPDVGPSPLQFIWTDMEGAEPVGGVSADSRPHSEYDDMFGANLSWWTGSATIRQNLRLTASKYHIQGNILYSACNNQNCIPPTKEAFSFSGTNSGAIADTDNDQPEEIVNNSQNKTSVKHTEQAADKAALWQPVDTSSSSSATTAQGQSMWYLFWMCFLGGFVALLTPCVWPMIPMTVSFFLKKNKSRAKAIADAVVYGISIIVIYLLLGLAVSALFGPQILNELATGAVFNIIFFLLLVIFAFSFFGAFDITLPSRLTNSVDSKAEKTTGILGIFFMAFTLTLVSFSCTGPIIGTLLVEAATSGSNLGPLVGMFGFSLALAIPFCLFAMFPSWLQGAPRSGNWMNTVKVVLGFVELALSLKFLSVADLAYGWHILDREAFLSIWIVVFSLLGAYLMGWFNFKHYAYAKTDGIGIARFTGALASFAFAVYLIPGLWGAPLKGVSAFVPPLYTQDFNLYGDSFVEYDDYDKGMEQAQKLKLPVLVDFSGYGCVNCRKMEGAVLDNEEIKNLITNNFVMIKLMVDDKRPLPEPIEVSENGKNMLLETYGDKWSYLQRHKFSANAQPYYVVLDNDGNLISGPVSYDENISHFKDFLTSGLNP